MENIETRSIFAQENEVSRALEDLEKQRVDEFFETLGRISLVKEIEYEFDFDTDQEPIKNTASRFKAYDYNHQPGIYLEKGYSEILSKLDDFSPLMARGRKSVNGVFFGTLPLINDGNENSELGIAVKPYRFDNPQRGCFNDFFSNAAVTALGFDTLKPVGMVVEENRAYSLTELEPSLTTFDMTDWEYFYPNVDEHPGMTEDWRHVAKIVALLHSATNSDTTVGNVSHGDLWPRNIGSTPDGNVILFDWEKSHISLMPPRDTEIKYGFTYLDIAPILESMCRPVDDPFKAGLGIFTNKGGNWWKGFEEIFYDEYLTWRRELAEIGKHHTVRLLQTEEELNQLTISLKEDIGVLQNIFGSK